MSQRIDDGHATLISFSLNANVKFYEKEVTPPGMQAGGENDTTTMRNIRWRTRAPKKLITLSNASASCSYDPVVYDEILPMLGVNQLITITFPDESTLAFWGWLDEFTPGGAVEGEQPVADVTIIPSNQNDDGEEVEPVYTAAA